MVNKGNKRQFEIIAGVAVNWYQQTKEGVHCQQWATLALSRSDRYCPASILYFPAVPPGASVQGQWGRQQRRDEEKS